MGTFSHTSGSKKAEQRRKWQKENTAEIIYKKTEIKKKDNNEKKKKKVDDGETRKGVDQWERELEKDISTNHELCFLDVEKKVS